MDVNTHTHTCMHACTGTHARAHAHTHTHTHTHTHHTHTCARASLVYPQPFSFNFSSCAERQTGVLYQQDKTITDWPSLRKIFFLCCCRFASQTNLKNSHLFGCQKWNYFWQKHPLSFNMPRLRWYRDNQFGNQLKLRGKLWLNIGKTNLWASLTKFA